jgi:hypothetical protein
VTPDGKTGISHLLTGSTARQEDVQREPADPFVASESPAVRQEREIKERFPEGAEITWTAGGKKHTGTFLCARRHIRASDYFGVETFESAVSPHATAVLDTDSAISPIRPTIKVAVSFRISSSLAKRFQYSARAQHEQAGAD